MKLTQQGGLGVYLNASLSYVNVARAYARQQGHNLLVSSTKNQPHYAVMVDRFIAMSAKHANLRLFTALTPERRKYKTTELLIPIYLY